jgi:hypothetical protein
MACRRLFCAIVDGKGSSGAQGGEAVKPLNDKSFFAMHISNILFLLILPLGMAAQPYGSGLVVNEFMASNDSLSGIVDPAGQSEDWIELYYNGSSYLNLESFLLSDKSDNPGKWVFPAGAGIDAGGYLIIWADEDGLQEGLHANFKLSKDGEFIILSNPFGEVLDSLTFGPQDTNVSFARRPNGAGNFVKQAPTFGYNNDEVSSVKARPVYVGERISLSPNPAADELLVGWSAGEGPRVEAMEVMDNMGRLMLRGGAQEAPFRLRLEGLSSGTYLLKLQTEEGIFWRRFIVKG